jgi:hypothetical protein
MHDTEPLEVTDAAYSPTEVRLALPYPSWQSALVRVLASVVAGPGLILVTGPAGTGNQPVPNVTIVPEPLAAAAVPADPTAPASASAERLEQACALPPGPPPPSRSARSRTASRAAGDRQPPPTAEAPSPHRQGAPSSAAPFVLPQAEHAEATTSPESSIALPEAPPPLAAESGLPAEARPAVIPPPDLADPGAPISPAAKAIQAREQAHRPNSAQGKEFHGPRARSSASGAQVTTPRAEPSRPRRAAVDSERD